MQYIKEIKDLFLFRSAILADDNYNKVSDVEVDFSYKSQHIRLYLKTVEEGRTFIYLVCTVNDGKNRYKTPDFHSDVMLDFLSGNILGGLGMFLDSCINLNNSIPNIKETVFKIVDSIFKKWDYYAPTPINHNKITIAEGRRLAELTNNFGERDKYSIHLFLVIRFPENEPASFSLIHNMTDTDSNGERTFPIAGDYISNISDESIDSVLDKVRASIYSYFTKHVNDISLSQEFVERLS